jgi:hypothetical protein
MVLDAEGAAHYCLMIGRVNWAITLGHHDVQHMVSALSYQHWSNHDEEGQNVATSITIAAPPPRNAQNILGTLLYGVVIDKIICVEKEGRPLQLKFERRIQPTKFASTEQESKSSVILVFCFFFLAGKWALLFFTYSSFIFGKSGSKTPAPPLEQWPI